jgi:CRP-like cAMP-binding protein
MSLIDGLPYSATIQAAGPCDFIRFAKQDFLLCTQKYPTMGIKLLTEIARLISLRLRHTSGLLVDVLSSET